MINGGTTWAAWRPRHLAAAVVVFGSSLGFASRTRSPARVDEWRPDCQHSYKGYQKPHDPALITEIAVAPLTSEIPEFHDCQKLIAPDGVSYVDGPVAIFAHQTLLGQWNELVGQRDTTTGVTSENIRAGDGGSVVYQGSQTDNDPRQQIRVTSPIVPAGDAVVVAEILNYGPEYATLGVKEGFNCLFVSLTAQLTLRAAMVKIANDQDCLKKAQFDTLLTRAGGKELSVRIIKPSRILTDYPPVARWDWDGRNNKHYIGIMCGAAWCEIGETGFGASPRYAGDRTQRIKGWYDEQPLAMTVEDAEGGESLIPSGVIGTVFPAPRLEAYGEATFKGHWVPVASVALSRSSDQYKFKLNLELSPAREAKNTISLCSGTKRSDCAPREQVRGPNGQIALLPAVWRLPECAAHDGKIWWTSIRAAKTGTEVYQCVHRRPIDPAVGSTPVPGWPQGIKVPATARWRWLLKDETIWQACIQGCCEIETDT